MPDILAPYRLPSDDSGMLKVLYLLTDRLYRSQSADDMHRAALDAIQAALQCRKASILLFDAAGVMRFVARRGLSDAYCKTLEGHSPWAAGARDAEAILVRDIRDSAEPEWIREAIEGEGIRGLGFFPLMVRGEVVGKFMTYHEQPHDFAERDIGVAVHIARQVGFSLERQRGDAERLLAEERLRESEERFRMICEHAPVMIWMSKPDGSCHYLNRMLRDFWNVGEKDLPSFSWADSMHPEDAARIGAQMLDALQRRVSASVKGRYRNARGDYRVLETDARPRFSAAGEFLGMIGVNADVTDTQRVQLELATALASLEVTLDGADAAPWQYDTETRRVVWSPRGYQQLGFGVGELEPSLEALLSQVHPDDREGVVKVREAERQAADGAKFALEFRIAGADGAMRWIERRSLAGPRSETGRVIYGVDIDISERKRAEEAVRESEERLRSLTANMPSAMVYQIAVTPETGARRFTFIASNCKQLNGVEAGEVIRDPGLLYGMILPEYLPVFAEREDAALKAKTPFDVEVPMRRADGGLRWFRISSAPRPGPGGDVLWDGIQVDVTARVNAEMAQRQAVAERENLAAEREAVLRQLAEGVIVTDASGRIVYVNQAAAAIHGTAELDVPVEGYSSAYRLFTEDGEPYPPDRLPLARAVLNRELVSEARWRISRADGVDIVAVGSASPLYRADESFLGAVLTLRDDTARHDAETALRLNQDRLAAAFKIGRIGIYDYDMRQSRAVNWDRLIRDIWGIAEGEFLSDEIFWGGVHPQDAEAVEKAVTAGTDPEGPRRYQSEYRVTSRTDGKTRWVHVDAAVSFEGREPVRILGTVQDITERKQAEEHIRMLMREVNHRSKNLLAVVQAIASQTALKSEPQTFTRVFRNRIQSLAASHDLVVKNAWEGADLHELVVSQLSHFEDLIGTRISISGAPLQVTPGAAQALGMALHELATNAGKYGSLSNASGTVAIAWQVTGAGFEMSWVEAGGPAVAAPEHKGFGTVLIVDTTANALSGTVNLDYAESGLSWRLTAAPSDVVAH